MTTYKIVRFYQRGGRNVIETGLTLEQAQLHCNDPETSSNSCASPRGLTHTKIHGPWFDGYEQEYAQTEQAAPFLDGIHHAAAIAALEPPAAIIDGALQGCVMDPQAALNELIQISLSTYPDPDRLNELADALIGWHVKGGFLPDLTVALDAALRRRREMMNG
jgi:hypothetical protein